MGCDDSMEESAIAIPDCIPALDSRDSTARIVRIAYPRLLYPVSFVSQSRHKRCKPQVAIILSKQVLGWSDYCYIQSGQNGQRVTGAQNCSWASQCEALLTASG